jgi:secondary thiamine-phosphate synthase enzyme
MKEINISTDDKKQIVDVTSEIQGLVKEENISEGTCEIFVLHTTCSLTTADLDPGTDKDYLDAVERMFPKGDYRHPHNPSHVGDHIMSSIVGNSVSVPIENGSLSLGTWQRVVLVELNGPRERKLKIFFHK